MSENDTILEHLQRQGVSRRSFLKFCSLVASSMALPVSSIAAFADALGASTRPKVIWLSAQECTGCSETLLRAWDNSADVNSPTLQNLLLDIISLDYHNTLMAPSGSAAEQSRMESIASGGHVVIIDGSIPLKDDGAWSVVGGRTILEVVKESVVGAGLVIAVGNCAAFGGLPGAFPNPTDAHGINDLNTIQNKLSIPENILINIPGCPPVPEVLTGVIASFIVSGVPPVDNLKRPIAFYGSTVHDNCSRLLRYKEGHFAKSFDDAGARQGYCLLELGCKGTITHNACTTTKWNMGTSYPMFSGHGCIGCSEPNFWDRKGGFYKSL